MNIVNSYAPIVIPTLNRFEHFKRCFESLERCTGAEYTDVYVGLDYPPSEKYVEGWKKIDTFLKIKENNNGFRNLYVRRRDHNCGVGKPGCNVELLHNEMVEKTDRYISTEDDNEFSPCFLDYMNKALEKYKDDERVIFVCGYTPFDYKDKDNIYFARQMFAWGFGSWIGKSKEIRKIFNFELLKSLLTDFNSSWKLYQYSPVMLSRLMDEVIRREYYGDVSYLCYSLLYDKYCMFPSKSLVRNWGNDGTGVHCKQADDSFINRSINQDISFDLDDVEVSECENVRKLIMKMGSKKWYGNIVIILRYFIWRISKKDIFSLRKFIKVINSHRIRSFY